MIRYWAVIRKVCPNTRRSWLLSMIPLPMRTKNQTYSMMIQSQYKKYSRIIKSQSLSQNRVQARQPSQRKDWKQKTKNKTSKNHNKNRRRHRSHKSNGKHHSKSLNIWTMKKFRIMSIALRSLKCMGSVKSRGFQF